MASALDWIRSKAAPRLSLNEEIEHEGRKYRSEWTKFRGKLPYRMRRELVDNKVAGSMIKTESEIETLRIERTHNGYETGFVDYTHIRYIAV